MADQKQFVLPVSIVSPTDVARLQREIEKIDDYFAQETIREAGKQDAMPRMSKLMDQLVTENQLNLLQEDHRVYVTESLGILHNSAPVLHMSFSVDPPGSYVQKIVGWMREHIHGQVLVTVGLQPNIGAGCIVRTTNRIFDFSLREYFNQKRDFFIDKMHQAMTDQPPAEVPAEAEQPAPEPANEKAEPDQSAEAPQPEAVTPEPPAAETPQPLSPQQPAEESTPAEPVAAPAAEQSSTTEAPKEGAA